MKISFITTVFNEEKTIEKFIDSLFLQTKFPDEIIIVDGASTDNTGEKIRSYEPKTKNKGAIFKLIIKKGNRSVGRNEAIKHATGDIIVCSDAGNILDKKWLENISKPFSDKKVDVVAGYYKGKATDIFQKCLIPYVLVMPDKVNPDTFLPATRSIAFTKRIWSSVGGFDEHYSHNEDYVFANKLKEKNATIVFAKDAIVYWLPRKTFKEAFVMFFRFALGDAEAKLWRTNVLLLLGRYFLGTYFLLLCLLYKSILGVTVLGLLFVLYLLWSIQKNYRYIKDKKAYLFLPALQITADSAVITGTLLGCLKFIKSFNYGSYVKRNKFLFFIILVYALILLTTIKWGAPNTQHPFPYQMDEWHQLQAVANTFRYGTPNTEGSANGTMFHFLLSGLYLIPFMIVKLIDPFSLQVDNGFMREKVFEVLRLQSIIFGMLSIFVFYKIAEKVNASKKLGITFFAFAPVWLVLSGYFKYDIALIFWILLSVLFLINFAKNPRNRNFILAALPSSLAIAVKVSAIPLLPIYIFSFFLFHPLWKRNVITLVGGLGIFLGNLFLFGFPDTLFGKGNIIFYLYDNLINNPNRTPNFILGIDPISYLFLYHYPSAFGYCIVLFSVIAILFYSFLIIKNGLRNYKIEFFILCSFTIFIISTFTLRLAAAGNRSLVILPFLVLLIALFYRKISKILNGTKILNVLMVLIVLVQLYQSFAWMYIKFTPSTQEQSSTWIERNIPKGTRIGIENIPIYQYIPDILQKEFYFQQYKINYNTKYRYEVITSESKQLPSVIVISNGEIETKLLKNSDKKKLVERLKREGYKQTITFTPHIEFYKVFGTESDYFISEIMKTPLTTTVYKR